MLQSQLQEQENIRKELKDRQAQAQQEMADLRMLIRQVQAIKEEIEADLIECKTKREVVLGKIVVEQKREDVVVDSLQGFSIKEDSLGEAKPVELNQPQAAPILEGTVLVVNKEFDFVVIDLGSQNGVSGGEVFAVSHNDRYIGDIQVERVQDAMTVCGFSSAEVEGKIEEGDKVIRK